MSKQRSITHISDIVICSTFESIPRRHNDVVEERLIKFERLSLLLCWCSRRLADVGVETRSVQLASFQVAEIIKV